MYSMVLMMALSNGAAAPALDTDSAYTTAARFGNHLRTEVEKKGCKGCKGCHGCYGGCGGCYGGWSCHGCYGGYSYGCHGYSYGCSGGYSYGCSGGCWGGYSGHAGHVNGGSYPGGYAEAPGTVIYSSGYDQPVDRENVVPPPADRRNQKRDGKQTREDEETTGPAPATITVRLPADARLTVDGNATTSSSSLRSFITPQLEPGKDFHYTLEARLTQDGKEVTLSKQVTVRAGQETQVTFDAPTRSVAQR